MKLLLDENLPHKLRSLLLPHDSYTVTYMGWNGVGNGQLLRLAADAGFEALISNDRGLEYEQNQQALPLAVVVLLLNDNRLKTLEAFVPAILIALEDLEPKGFTKIPPEL